jgi:ferredoxin
MDGRRAIASLHIISISRSKSMKATVDSDLCIGCGLCVDICPEVFEMEGDKAVPKVDPVPPAAEETCRDAAEQCPVEAIKIGG